MVIYKGSVKINCFFLGTKFQNLFTLDNLMKTSLVWVSVQFDIIFLSNLSPRSVNKRKRALNEHQIILL